MYLGDYAEDYTTLNFKFTTRALTGIPTQLAGSPVISVYKGSATDTEKTSSESYITLSVDFDGKTGLNGVLINLNGDAFFATGEDYNIVLTTGTVDSVNVAGETIATFSIENRYTRGTDSANKTVPDAAGVVATYIGIAGANLTNVSLNTAYNDAKTAAQEGDAMTLSDAAITAAKFDTDAISAAAIKADAVTEIQSGLSTHTAANVKTAIETDGSKIDHLWEMTENDGGTRRLTENALEEAPSGTVSEAGIADIVTGVLAGAVDGTLTVAEALKRIHSAELCKAVVTVDATETTIACYDEADTDVVITLTVQNDFSGRTKS